MAVNRISLLLAFLAILSAPAYAEPASSESVKRLLQNTGAAEIGTQIFNQMLPVMKSTIPAAPESFWDEVVAEMNVEEIIDLVVPIYQRHLSQEDVDAVADFYASPAGQRFLEAQPAILQESMAVGSAWGEEITRRIMEKYQAANTET